MTTLTACLTVIAGWLVLAAALIGVGRVARRLVAGQLGNWSAGDFWTGLAVVIALVLLAHLVVPVTSWLWLGLGPLAVAGLALRPRPVRGRVGWVWRVLTVLVALYVADRALQALGSYDSGLYHLPLLDWLHAYPAVPGLGNFYGRLGYNPGSLIFTALTGTVVPASIAQHFANSLLMVAACLETLFAVRGLGRRGLTPAAYAPGVLLVLAAPALLPPLHSFADISSPSLDLPAVVVTLMAAYYTARAAVSAEVDPAVLVPAVALLALLPVVRVQLGVFTVVAGAGLAVALVTRRITVSAQRRVVPLLVGLSMLVVGSWVVHGVVLTGYPAFPATALGLPVSWKVPASYAHLEQDWIRSWARTPGDGPTQVLPHWGWVPLWTSRMVTDPAILGMLILVGAGLSLFGALALARLLRHRLPRRGVQAVAGVFAVGATAEVFRVVRHSGAYPERILTWGVLALVAIAAAVGVRALLAVTRNDRERRWSLAPALVGLAGVATCVAWFFLAPEPRFVTGVLWVTASVPAVAALSWLWPRHREAAAVALVVCLAVASAYPVKSLQNQHLFRPDYVPAGKTRWGLLVVPVVPPKQTVSVLGTAMNVPASGDQCWADSLPCAPDASRPWRLRQPGHLSGGFVMVGK